MTNRPRWGVIGTTTTLMTLAVILAACSSGSQTAGTTASAASTSVATSAPTSPGMADGTEQSEATDQSFEPSRPVATTTVGGDATSLDAQSTAWFEAMCTGMAPLADLTKAATQQEVSDGMIAAGEAFRSTSATLGTLPAPTFEGGDVLAANTVSGFQVAGTAFTDLGQRVLEIEDGDTTGQQQIAKDLQAAAEDTPIAQMQLTPALTAAVQQIPACQTIFAGS